MNSVKESRFCPWKDFSYCRKDNNQYDYCRCYIFVLYCKCNDCPSNSYHYESANKYDKLFHIAVPLRSRRLNRQLQLPRLLQLNSPFVGIPVSKATAVHLALLLLDNPLLIHRLEIELSGKLNRDCVARSVLAMIYL